MAKKRKQGGMKARPKPVASRPEAKPEARPQTQPAEVTDETKPEPTESAGKQRRRAAGEQRRQREERAELGGDETPLPPPEAPAFWFGFEVTWAKLALARFVVFGLLALDALLQIRHAPRYGIGGFNVAQLPGLDALGPTRAVFVIAQMSLAYLFGLAACGVATRLVLPLAAATYAWLYFSSQLDSFQHHYLMSLLLLLACFVPWRKPDGARPVTPIRSWALRLVLIQLGIMYLWAAISKMTPAWIDGRTLALQITGPLRTLIDSTMGIVVASWMVVAVELGLAATIWSRRTWKIAAPLGILLHAGILVSGLEIGLFAWLMLGLYVLVVPDRVWTFVATSRWPRGLAAIGRIVAGWFDGYVALVLAAGLGCAAAALCRLPFALVLGAIASGAIVLGGIVVRRRGFSVAAFGIAHVLALGTWVLVDRASTDAAEYYKFWGSAERRLGDVKIGEQAYRRMIEIAPDDPSGHYQLGKMLLVRGADTEGLEQLHQAERLEPTRARAFVAEGRWLAAHGRLEEAIQKVREATIVDETDAEAKTLLDQLQKGAPIAAGSDSDAP